MRQSTYVIAEAGVNHNGSMKLAHELVEIAHAAGADAVKFQTFVASRLASTRAKKADYQERTTGAEESQFTMLKRLELAPSAHHELKAQAEKLGIEFLSTPFDEDSLRMLVELGVRRIKLGSGEVTNEPLLRAAAQSKLPIILSTGMSNLGEVEAALGVMARVFFEQSTGRSASAAEALGSDEGQRALEEKVTLLHCTTEYPAPLEDTNLRVLETLRGAFGVPIGYSDHTEGFAVPVAAVALGATVIEKHFTSDRSLPGPDHLASVEPADLKAMVSGIRAVEIALGRPFKRPAASERANTMIARRSLVARVRIPKGAVLTRAMLDAKRPADGLSPMRIEEVLGRVATRDYVVDDLIEL